MCGRTALTAYSGPGPVSYQNNVSVVWPAGLLDTPEGEKKENDKSWQQFDVNTFLVLTLSGVRAGGRAGVNLVKCWEEELGLRLARADKDLQYL